MSKRAYDIVVGLLEKADNRNPDAFGMYIYNDPSLFVHRPSVLFLFPAAALDFFNYGLLDLVDKTLSNIHTKIVKKNYDEAFDLFEALTFTQPGSV